ncbi:hypothetical protein GGQ64_002887 [Rhizobium azooxidifex]|uniref:Uncharacterized protein n=1 Tax=Mycoplana azooxidifex TaxID=1636188 RepID=A0A7W6DAG3_9HYPH|nr:hypothetical protein [Mycoplana azooxidifex]
MNYISSALRNFVPAQRHPADWRPLALRRVTPATPRCGTIQVNPGNPFAQPARRQGHWDVLLAGNAPSPIDTWRPGTAAGKQFPFSVHKLGHPFLKYTIFIDNIDEPSASEPKRSIRRKTTFFENGDIST